MDTRTAPSGPEIGLTAPDFELPAIQGLDGQVATLSLESFRGHWLLLLFYPRDFSMVCPSEITSMNARMDEFDRMDCRVVAVSTDSIETHRDWMRCPSKQGGIGDLKFHLASDEEGAASRSYGVYSSRQHAAHRGVFVIDPEGVLQYFAVHNQNVGRGTSDLLRMLAALKSDGLCSANWSPGTPNLDALEVLTPGRIVSQYEIVKRIASGAMGVVFEAYDRSLRRPAALKLLRAPGHQSARKLLDEARLAAALNHPNICTIYAVDDSVGFPMIAMELLAGETLEQIQLSGPLDADVVARWGAQVADGLAAAHASGLVHGDLKPGNLIVSPQGTVKILDFGLAHRGESIPDSHEATGVYGTPAYMSPEQTIGGRPGAVGDLFAFGLILYEMLKGQQLIRGSNLIELFECINSVDAAAVAADCPAPFDSVLTRALQLDPAARTQSAAEIAACLRSHYSTS